MEFDDPLLATAEALEKAAADERVAYYRPMVACAGGGLRCAVLDLGCGNGYAVAAWRRRDVSAVGVDNSLYRLYRWVKEKSGVPLVLGDATRLPFRRGAFAAAVSSGVIEHVGVFEEPTPYRITPDPDRDEKRARTMREGLLAVTSGGALYVDFPNGSFPIDFWHGDVVGSFRVHPVPDALLPRYADVVSWVRPEGASVRLVPLGERLRFQQVGRHWWGRLLRPLARLYVIVLDTLSRVLPARVLAPLFPFLVLRITKPRLA
jgi:SAM-dependent methyltransferase